MNSPEQEFNVSEPIAGDVMEQGGTQHMDTNKPQIKTELPGPKGKAIIERDAKVMSTSLSREVPLVVERTQDVWIFDVDGNQFLDMTSGVGVTNVGHTNPLVVQAIKEQAEKFLHFAGTDFYYESQVTLGEMLNEIRPFQEPGRVFFTNSGTESVEASIKLARYKSKRPLYIGFLGAFHGRSMGSLAFTSSKAVQRRYFSPMMPGVVHIPFPDSYRPPEGVAPEKVTDYVIWYLNRVFETIAPPEDVAAVLVEPIQGEGGYIVPPSDFFPRLKEELDKYGIYLIVDEVQSGMGRTGKMFAIQNFGVEPDIVAIAKGIASGMPMGASLARESVMDWEESAHSNTYGGNPVAAVAAIETIKLLRAGLVENAAKVGTYFMAQLRELQKRYEQIGDVRGIGLMLAIDFVKDPVKRDYNYELRNKVIEEAFKRGLVCLGAGQSAIRFAPPLTLTEQHVDVAIEILDDAIKAALN